MATARPGRSKGGRFLKLPKNVFDSEAYIGLSYVSKALLIEIGMQYYGTNNGNLEAHYGLMKERGWRSKSTLFKARKELVAAGFIVETKRNGRLSKKPNKYAITWQAIDVADRESTGLVATKVPLNLWKPKKSTVRNMDLKKISVPECGPEKCAV